MIIQSNEFNASRIATVIAVVVTSNLRLAEAPGNVLLRAKATGLKRDSVANVSQLVTIDKSFLTGKAGRVAPAQMQQIEAGLELVLGL